jgi:glycosyltransferase involved in cell wall biosynthesis
MLILYLPNKHKYEDRFYAFKQIVIENQGILLLGEGEEESYVRVLGGKSFFRKIINARRLIRNESSVIYIDTFGILFLSALFCKNVRGGSAFYLDAFSRGGTLLRQLLYSPNLFLHDIWYILLHFVQINMSSFLIFQNKFIAEKYEKVRIFNRGKSFVIPNSLNLDNYCFRERILLKPKINLISVGCNTEYKGLFDNMEYVQSLIDAGWIVDYKIIGVFNPSVKQKLYERYSRVMQKTTIMDGEISHNDLLSLFQEVDCIVHLSTNEGMSRVVCEAAACGIRPILRSHKINNVFFENGILQDAFMYDSNDYLKDFRNFLDTNRLIKQYRLVLQLCVG